MTGWSPDPEALRLLESRGGPFETEAYRRAWLSVFPAHADASWGGRLPDGTRAAVAALRVGDTVESLPTAYGGIVATRALEGREARGFLEHARRASGARHLVARSVALGQSEERCHVGAMVAGWTSVVRLTKAADLEATFDKMARRALRQARDAGARARVSERPDPFVALYDVAAREYSYRHPAALLRAVVGEGLARFYEVELDGAVVASVMALVRGRHWMAWLAAQSERGRDASTGYLAFTKLLEHAAAAGISAVDLGISADMPGVALFKRRLGAVEVPVLESRSSRPLAGLPGWLAKRGWRRLASALRR